MRARLEHMHMSRPSSVWLTLKHLEWFDCVGGCTATSGEPNRETERKQRISCSIKVWEKIEIVKKDFCVLKKELD